MATGINSCTPVGRAGPLRQVCHALRGLLLVGLGALSAFQALVGCHGGLPDISPRRPARNGATGQRLGVDWTRKRIVVLKSSSHFHADFGPGAEAVSSVLSPGAYDPDAARHPYRRLRPGARLGPHGA